MEEFKLSAALYGHSLDVRSITVTSDNSIVSGSRDKTARLWKCNAFSSGYAEVMAYRDQKNFVACVLFLEPTTAYPDGLVITGGNDNLLLVYKPSEPFAALTLREHTNAVCCISKGAEPNTFLSGSWDTNAKYWNLEKGHSSVATFRGHSASVWSVIQRSDGNVVTGSADKSIRIWSKDGQQLATLEGHLDCIRGLEDFPELRCFISVSNDASIKAWSYAGDTLNTYYGHTSYIYSIARCKAGGENCFVTSDEDYTIRYWQNGVNTQSIRLPAQSVWCVACLSNGDIAAGGSDGIIRIFTRDPARVADAPLLAKYGEEVEAVLRQSNQVIGGVKVSDLPGREGLLEPGTKAGQMKMIREPQGVAAYSWVEAGEDSHWERMGEVLGGTDKDATGKTVYEGQSYDYVFTVDVEDGKPPLKLPYNKGEDPYDVAFKFLAKNNLPHSYVEQVVNFILKNAQADVPQVSNSYADPFTGESRYTPGSGGGAAAGGAQHLGGSNADPLTGGSSYWTGARGNSTAAAAASMTTTESATSNSSSSCASGYFPMTTYRTFDMGDPKVILAKLNEFNEKFCDGYVDKGSLEEVVKICNGAPSDPNAFDVLFKLLEWPDEIIFPVLDVIRLAVRNATNNKVLTTMNNGVLLEKLKNYISDRNKVVNNLIVSLRTVVNMFSHEDGENLMLENRFDILESITSLSSLNKNAEIGLATILLNMTIGVIKSKDELGVSVLADVIPDILSKLSDPESQFRAYVALGTLTISAIPAQVQEVKLKVKQNDSFMCKLEQHCVSGSGDLETKRRNCAQQVRELLSK